MVVLDLLHLVSAGAGIGGTLGLLAGGTERESQFSAMMWVGLVGVAGTGLVLALSGVGAGAAMYPMLLLGKVILTIVLGGITYVIIPPGDTEPSADPVRLGGMVVLWVTLFWLGGAMVH